MKYRIKPCFFGFVAEHAFSGGGTANIAHADEKHTYHI
jgi:hypothetical protein